MISMHSLGRRPVAHAPEPIYGLRGLGQANDTPGTDSALFGAAEVASALFALGLHPSDPYDPGRLVSVPEWDVQLVRELEEYAGSKGASVTVRIAGKLEVEGEGGFYDENFPREQAYVSPFSLVDTLMQEAQEKTGEGGIAIPPPGGEVVVTGRGTPGWLVALGAVTIVGVIFYLTETRSIVPSFR